MKIYEIKADLLNQPNEYSIAHCISLDCAMGAGVALAICNKYKNLRYYCRNQYRYLGQAIEYIADRAIYNIITKEHYWEKCNREISWEVYKQRLQSGLYQIKQCMLSKGETKLAIPKIGSGLDRCNWNDVKQVITDAFQDTDIEIKVCYL